MVQLIALKRDFVDSSPLGMGEGRGRGVDQMMACWKREVGGRGKGRWRGRKRGRRRGREGCIISTE